MKQAHFGVLYQKVDLNRSYDGGKQKLAVILSCNLSILSYGNLKILDTYMQKFTLPVSFYPKESMRNRRNNNTKLN